MKIPALNRLRFAVCVNAGEYPASLEQRKIYEVWPDSEAESEGLLRVVDESGEDYLFPADYFRILTLPRGVGRLIRTSGRPAGRQPVPRRRAASKTRR